ncbi:MAG TPA: hypothetical protein VGQ92_19525 [Actinoplanes sp.]|jgi:hypothetical protein|nr:hypothetical protein [Actinoplanes sp.]
MGLDGSTWLVAALLALTLGLAAALYVATRAAGPSPVRGRRPR